MFYNYSHCKRVSSLIFSSNNTNTKLNLKVVKICWYVLSLPCVVVCRSSGKQHAPEAAWSTKLPQESSVGVLGVHSNHYRLGHRRFQWVPLLLLFPFMNAQAHQKWCHLLALSASTQTKFKETLLPAVWSFSWRTGLLINVTPNSLIEQHEGQAIDANTSCQDPVSFPLKL